MKVKDALTPDQRHHFKRGGHDHRSYLLHAALLDLIPQDVADRRMQRITDRQARAAERAYKRAQQVCTL